MDRGSFIHHDGRPAVRFERTFDHPVDRVWKAVTDPAELACWFPSEVDFEPNAGATITFSGDPHAGDATGTVLAFDPPRSFSFTWADGEVHLELTDHGESRCTLTLVNVLTTENEAARNAAGWTVCLGELGKLLTAGAADGPHGSENNDAFQPLYDEYVASGVPAGAEIPH